MLSLKIFHAVHTVYRNGEEAFAFRVCEKTASPGVADKKVKKKKKGVKQVNINVINVTEKSMEIPQK